VDAYTAGSAYTEFMEDKKGRIKPGYLADMVVLNKDIFTIDPKEIRDMYAELTMMDGKVVYRR
jgi:predicted amidohydrolase YtcJ